MIRPLALTLALACGLATAADLRVNLTASMPKGVYAIERAEPRRGDFVSLCPPDAWAALALSRGYLKEGSCQNGAQPLLKRLAGLPGDAVAVSPEGVRINGELWQDSAPRERDSSGRFLSSALPDGSIPDGLALVLSEHPGGFDGRYFGLVPLGAISRAIPLLTFNSKE